MPWPLLQQKREQLQQGDQLQEEQVLTVAPEGQVQEETSFADSQTTAVALLLQQDTC